MVKEIFNRIISDFVHNEDDKIFTENYPSFNNHRVGTDKSKLPIILIHSKNNTSKHYPPTKLDLLKILFNKSCDITSENTTKTFNFTIIKLNSEDPEITSYFFKIIHLFINKIGNEPDLVDVYKELNKMLDLFSKGKKISKKLVQGLFSEMVIINSSKNIDDQTEAWHNQNTDRFDFNDSEVKIEVKSTSKYERIHNFRASQLESKTPLFIASLLIIESGNGKTVLNLKDEIEKKLSKTTNKIKLNEVVLETLGLNYLSSNRFKFDYNYCLENLLFFDLKNIPVIEKNCIPENYSKLSFEVDFTSIKSTETESGFDLVDNCII